MDLKKGGFLERVSVRKPIELHSEGEAERKFCWYHLLGYGISATVGGGIYVVMGNVVKNLTGPSIVFSVMISSILALSTAFSYTELASVTSLPGTNYTYAYTFMGEYFGWIFGWTSTLEYSFAGSITASFLVSNLVSSLSSVNMKIPTWLYNIELSSHFYLNILAGILVLVMMLVILQGIDIGIKVNTFLSLFNLMLFFLIIGIGLYNVNPDNWRPFVPYSYMKILHGSATLIYSYVGFNTMCTFSQNAKSLWHLNVAIVGTVFFASVVYILLGLVVTGMVPLQDIVVNTSIASAFMQVDMAWMAHVISISSSFMMCATLLVCLLGQPDVFKSMASDGLLPQAFGISSKRHVPRWSIVASCLIAAVFAACVHIEDLCDMSAIGAISGFIMSSSCLILHRLRASDKAYKVGKWCLVWLVCGLFVTFFSFVIGVGVVTCSFLSVILIVVPIACVMWVFIRFREEVCGSRSLAVPIIPLASILGNGCVLCALDLKTYVRFAVWVFTGSFIYFAYGYRRRRFSDFTKESLVKP